MELEQLNKIEGLLEELAYYANELFYAIPLVIPGKPYRGYDLRQKVNEIQKTIREIAKEFNIKLK